MRPIRTGRKRKITIIGAGGGSAAIIRGMYNYCDNMYAVVNVTDYGGNARIYRDELGIISPGDFKGPLYEMGDRFNHWRELMIDRLADKQKTSVGNVIISNLISKYGPELGIFKANQLVGIKGYRVKPISLDYAHVEGLKSDNTIISKEGALDTRSLYDPTTISSIYLNPSAYVYKGAAYDLRTADLVVVASGSPLTSVIPNFRVIGVPEAINQAGKIILVMNLYHSKRESVGELHCGKASAIAEAYFKCLGGERKFDAVICNTNIEKLPTTVRNRYTHNHEVPIIVDEDRLEMFCKKVITGDFAEPITDAKHHEPVFRHNELTAIEIVRQ